MDGQTQAHTLQTTALIHEAYIRLAGDPDKQWQNRAHFFGVAAKAMRHVLVDYARANHSAKRGGGQNQVSLEGVAVISAERLAEFKAVDDALSALAKLSRRQANVVELRFFGGMTVEETAALLKVSPETVMRDWRAARAWLYAEIGNVEGRTSHTDDA
jgi:RNA polymerase sigma-70 factor, ECF subfamily